nr:hypothetical protein [Tanacetum cinerariifolium]
MIATPGEPDLPVPVPESFHEQTDDELTKTDIKRMDADDQAIQTILLGLPEDVYAGVDSCETSKEIWEHINDPTEAINAALILFAKVFQLSVPTNNNQRISSNPRNRQIAQPVMNMCQDRQIQNVGGAQNAAQNASVQNGGNQNGLVVVPGIANQSGTSNVVAARAEGTGNRNQAGATTAEDWEEAWKQLQAEEFDFMAAAGDLDEIEEVNANYILMANLQQASTSGTQHDKAPVYDTDSSVEVQLNDNCYDNELFNMFTQEEQYTDLLEPIPEPQLVPQNDNHVTSVTPSMVHSGGTLETSYAPNEETRAHQETVYRNLVDQVTQTMHMLNPKPDSFYHSNQKMTLGYPNPSYLKKAQLKQQSLYNGNLLLEEHDPPAVYDSEETLELAQESREKIRFLKKEIKPVNYAKINHLSGISYDKAYNDMQQKVERLQAQLRDLKGKSSDTSSASNTLDPLNQKLESKIVELDFQVINYEREISHLKTTYKNLNVIAPGMFKINPSQTPRAYLVPNKQSSASIRTNPITKSQRHVIVKENVSSNTVTASSTGLVHTARTRRSQPKGNTRNARVPSASKSSEAKKNITVE